MNNAGAIDFFPSPEKCLINGSMRKTERLPRGRSPAAFAYRSERSAAKSFDYLSHRPDPRSGLPSPASDFALLCGDLFPGGRSSRGKKEASDLLRRRRKSPRAFRDLPFTDRAGTPNGVCLRLTNSPNRYWIRDQRKPLPHCSYDK